MFMNLHHVSFETFMVMMFQVESFWVVMPHNVVTGYQCFRGSCCLHFQGEEASIEESGIHIGPDWRGAAGATSQQEVWRK
jgi:hypothetical protein